MFLPRKALEDFWNRKRKTVRGQIEAFFVLGVLFGLSAAFSTEHLSTQERLGALVGSTVLITVSLVLILVIPSRYLAFIRRRLSEGRTVTGHRILFGLYCFPFLPYAFVGCVMGMMYFLGILN